MLIKVEKVRDTPEFLRGDGTKRVMAERPTSYEYADLLTCGRGELFGPGNAQLPLPPMLMFERIASITEAGGAHGKGQVVAEMKIAGNPAFEWVWACHFRGDPVMPGCLAVDALWQLTGFFLGWLGAPGRGRALGVGEVKFTGMVFPTTGTVQYVVDLKRVILRRLKLAIADGVVKADGQVVFAASDLRVALAADAGEQPAVA
jgi:3-hydroxyacyl-[acyl-carrier protein] dehydratase/trans-2-decenoyl-[acyl-carrier protein] isomerase